MSARIHAYAHAHTHTHTHTHTSLTQCASQMAHLVQPSSVYSKEPARERQGCPLLHPRTCLERTRLTTLTPPPTRAPREPFASTTRAPSVPHGSVWSRRPSGACPACTSPILARCASPPGTAYAPLSARLCPARAPRGSTRGPRGAGGPSGPWEVARVCSAGTSSVGRRCTSCPSCPTHTHWHPGSGSGVVCAPGCTHRSRKGVAQFARFAHCFVIQSLWGSQIFYFIF